jgi:hypothetical protein
LLRYICVLPPVLLGACTTVDLGHGKRSMTFVGVVRVEAPARSGDFSAVGVESLGIGWDSGIFLGWRAGSWVSADPSKCQMLVIIRKSVEAEAAAGVLQSLGGTNACVADFSNTLRP